MDDNFDTCLAFTLKEEGGYSDNPADPGGATNMGITLATYRRWSDNPNLGPVQVQDMTERTARAIYRSLYWNPLRADALPVGVDRVCCRSPSKHEPVAEHASLAEHASQGDATERCELIAQELGKAVAGSHRFQNPCDEMRYARLKREDAFSHAMIIVSSAMVSSS